MLFYYADPVNVLCTYEITRYGLRFVFDFLETTRQFANSTVIKPTMLHAVLSNDSFRHDYRLYTSHTSYLKKCHGLLKLPKTNFVNIFFHLTNLISE